MSIEALWALQFTGTNQGRVARSGGVVVLETGRIFGGDTWQWYTGTYSRKAEGLYTVALQTGVHYTVDGESIFGGSLLAQKFSGELRVAQDQRSITAMLTVDAAPHMSLTAVLTRVAELP